MVPPNRAVATSYRLSSVNSNKCPICSGLATILNGMFKAISGRILQMAIDTAYGLIRSGIRPVRLDVNH